MNYLAHLYLSGSNKDILIGNFIADHLKGKLRNHYDGEILKGIQLHHAIDSYTDSHPVVEVSKNRIRSRMNKYTPVVVDVYYDHFLASNWQVFHKEGLADFAHNVYLLLEANNHILPERTNHMLTYMRQQNWLVGYADLQHLERIFINMGRRSKFDNNMHLAVEFLLQDYDLFQSEFNLFFEDLKKMCSNYLLNA